FLKWLQQQVEYIQNARGITLQSAQLTYEIDENGEPSFGIEVVPLVIEATAEGKI
ncbi:hypothetical protein AAIK81_003659, partial [Acinetobacter baumannii]